MYVLGKPHDSGSECGAIVCRLRHCYILSPLNLSLSDVQRDHCWESFICEGKVLRYGPGQATRFHHSGYECGVVVCRLGHHHILVGGRSEVERCYIIKSSCMKVL